MIAKIIAMTNKDARGIDEQGQIIRLKALSAVKDGGFYVGDNVELDKCVDGVWTFKSVLPRKNLLNRPVIANLDQAFITISIVPQVDFLILDKILVNCEMNNIAPFLVLNKADLLSEEFISDIKEQYEDCVEDIIITNAITGENVDKLHQYMSGKISAFIGQSAVGKSTILNCLEIGKDLKTSELTLKAGKKKERGRNTTRASTLYQTKFGDYVADSPGFWRLDLSLIRPQELVFYFPDLMKYRTCKYSNCTHLSEGQDCGLQLAYKNGLINQKRFDRFIKLQAMLNQKWRDRYE